MTETPDNATPDSGAPAPRRRSATRGFVFLALLAIVVLMAREQFYPAPSESVVDWGKDLPAALASAREQNRPVLIAFSSPACIYCKKMEAEVFPEEDVRAEVDNFVTVKIDTSKDAETSFRYRVDPLPTYIVATAGGTEITRLEGYAPADRFTRFLQAGRLAATSRGQ